MDQIEKVFRRDKWKDLQDAAVQYLKIPNCKARTALAMAERFALVAAIPEGEDSAGRQKLRLPSAEECAKQACDLSDALWEQFETRGWLLDTPDLEAPAEGEDS